MLSRLPLFPLTTALVPGLVLPLHVFEPRYRDLVEELLAEPDEDAREFAVVAVRDGHDADREGQSAMYPVGTATILRQVERHADGRYDIVTTGSRRFFLVRVDASEPLMRADVEFIDDTVDVGDAALAARVASEFQLYRAALSGQLTDAIENDDGDDELPADSTVLSFLVTAAMVLPTDERQAMLAATTTDDRLRLARRLLRRETVLIARIGAVPALDPVFTVASAN